MFKDLIKKCKGLDLPELIIQNDQRVISTGQETNVAYYILAGKVRNEDSSLPSDNYYQPGDVVCIRDFLGSKTYLKNHKAIAGTTLICLTVEIFKETFFSNDGFAWSLSKLLASESLHRRSIK